MRGIDERDKLEAMFVDVEKVTNERRMQYIETEPVTL